MSTLNVASINSGPIGGMRNALINGNPTINQRGYVSGTATTGANQYTLDRWRVVVSGQALSWTDNENTRTVTAPAGGVEQVVEGINLLSGSYVLSWVGTATATINGAPVSNGSPVTLVGGVNTTVRFSGGTFALAQLEPGTRATPFERRSYGQELSLCQRYYQLVGNGAIGATAATDTVHFSEKFAVEMRVAPTMSWVTGATARWRYGVADLNNGTNNLLNAASTKAGMWSQHGSYAGLTVNIPIMSRNNNADSLFVACSAEL